MVCGDDQIAGQHDFDTAAQRNSIQSGNDRFIQIP
jgi:hypothetical protein